MYETVDSLFTGICDSIREKDGTTALISHQDIPARISAISGDGSGSTVFTSSFYTHDNGTGLKIENMVVSNFDGNSAIYLPDPFLPGDSAWEIQVKLVWPNVARENQVFGDCKKGYRYAPLVIAGISSEFPKQFFFGIPDGVKFDDWNYRIRQDIDVTAGETYWFRVGFDGDNTYYASMSTDGKTFSNIGEFNYGVMYQDEQSRLSLGKAFGGIGYHFTSSIDLKETWIKIGGEVWWGGNKSE